MFYVHVNAIENKRYVHCFSSVTTYYTMLLSTLTLKFYQFNPKTNLELEVITVNALTLQGVALNTLCNLITRNSNSI